MKKSIERGTASVGVVGLGYVGAPLAELACMSGFQVEGIDPYIESPPEPLSSHERFRHTRDFEGVSRCDVLVLCVPTPLTARETPDMSYVEEAVRGVAGAVASTGRGGRPLLVVLESTSYPGTTREVVLPPLERAGMKPGNDLYLAYAPERIDPGRSGHDLAEIPRVVGGIDADSGDLADAFYTRLGCAVHRASSPEVAEMSKLLENVFRAVNIALVNEMSLLCRRMGIDVWQVVEAAATKPFGFMSFKPGPGMGGHCIPVDPFYLAWRAKQYDFNPEFIELAGKINRRMPHHVLDWVAEALDSTGKSISGSRVLVIGVAYKEGVSDTRESPALKVIELLAGRGAIVSYHDSLVPSVEAGGTAYSSRELTEETLGDADCILLMTAHPDLELEMLRGSGLPLVDTRNALG